jgi:tetratricopeptide (TPR) repeat protein
MNLLLDARKKTQQAQSAQDRAGNHSGRELSLEPHPDPVSKPVSSAASSPDARAPDNKSRHAGQNLFDAKSRTSSFPRDGINRNLLIALGGTVLLLTAGAGYVWYAISSSNTQLPRPTNKPAVASLNKPVPPPTQNITPPEIISPQVVLPRPAGITKPSHSAKSVAKTPHAPRNAALHIEQHQEEPIDPLLNNAFLAYRSGKFEQAQQLYRQALNLDSSNTDALLGLAVIAQRRGEDSMAAHYYAQVMTLDPRNAVANAGMSALTTGSNRESRLKTLLNEQQDSSTLYFALGNYYAEQARWGEAQQAYFNAYKLESGNAELAFNLAVSLDRLGQKKPAAQYYQRALQLDPDNHANFDHAKIVQRVEDLIH